MLKKISSIVINHLILPLLILSLVIPPQLAFANDAPASSITTPTTTSTTVDAQDASDGLDLVKAQAKRDRAIGRDSTRSLIDPYRILDQKIIVRTPTSAKKDVSSETVERVFLFGIDHNDFPPAPVAYSLEKDIQIKIDGNKLQFIWNSVEGQPLRDNAEYIHEFVIEGIQNVIKDKQHVHILLKNGDILTIFMAHNWLFQAEAKAGGGPTIVPFVGALSKDLSDESGVISPRIELQFYNRETASKLVWPTGFNLKSLYYGDIIAVDTQDSAQHKVVDITTYKEIIEALEAHFKFMVHRQRLIDGNENPLGAFMELSSEVNKQMAAGGSSVHAEILNQITGGAPIEQRLSEIHGISLFGPIRLQDWNLSPGEQRRFDSTRLQIAAGFLNTAASVVSSPNNRASHDHTKTFDANSPEGKFKSLLQPAEKNIGARKSSWNRIVAGSVAAGIFLGKRVALVGSPLVPAAVMAAFNGDFSVSGTMEQLGVMASAIWNSALHILPASFAETKHFLAHLGTAKVNAWDLPFGLSTGPQVLYGVKYLLLSAATALGFYLLPRYVFTRLDKKVLGRELPKNIISGLQVYYTMALRAVAPAFKSLATRAAEIVDNFNTRFRKQDSRQGLADRLEAARAGIEPSVYKQQKANLTSPLIQDKVHQAQLIALRSGWSLLLRSLISIPRFSQMTQVTAIDLREKLTADEFENFSKRLAVFLFRIQKIVNQRTADKNELLSPSEIDSLIVEIEKNIKPTDSVLTQLSADEIADFASLTKSQKAKMKWAKWAGQNELYNKFKRGEVPKTVIEEAVGWNSLIDFMIFMPFFVATPDFSDLNQPNLLVASDRYRSLLGLSNPYVQVELGINVALWASQTPNDILVWSRDEAGRLASAYMHPELLNESSLARELLKKSKPATPSESSQDYGRGFKGLNFWYGIEKLGKRISVAEIKGIKIFLSVVTALTMVGYILGDPSSVISPRWSLTLGGIFGGTWDTVVALANTYLTALKKGIFSTTWAFICYRPLWMWHNLGLRESDGYRRNKMEQFAFTIKNAGQALIEIEDNPSGLPAANDTAVLELRKHLSEIESLYIQNKIDLPANLKIIGQNLGVQELVERAHLLIVHSVENPPAPMKVNALSKTFSTINIAIWTTIIGCFAAGLTWSLPKILPWWSAPFIFTGLYGVGRAAASTGNAARIKFGYVRKLNQLQAALKNYHQQNIPLSKRKENLFRSLLAVNDLYTHFELGIPTSVLNVTSLNPQSNDLLAIGKRTYEFMLQQAPSSRAWGNKIARNAIQEHRKKVPTALQRSPTDIYKLPQSKECRGFLSRLKDAAIAEVNLWRGAKAD